MLKEGPCAPVSLPSQQYQSTWGHRHSVKSRTADRSMLRSAVLGVGGTSAEWQMASTRHISRSCGNEADLQNLGVTFLFLHSCPSLILMHLHYLVRPSLVHLHDTVIKTEQGNGFSGKAKRGAFVLKSYLFQTWNFLFLKIPQWCVMLLKIKERIPNSLDSRPWYINCVET